MTNRLYDIDDIIDSLKQQRDEIKLQIHLAEAEARDEFPAVEQKLEELKSKTDAIREEAGEISDDVLEAVKLVADEVKNGIERIRKLM